MCVSPTTIPYEDSGRLFISWRVGLGSRFAGLRAFAYDPRPAISGMAKQESSSPKWGSEGGAVSSDTQMDGERLIVQPLHDRDNEHWYAVHTQSRHEKKIDAHLRQKGITTFLPLITQVHYWSDRRKKVEMPLFPCYTFVRIPPDAHARLAVLKAPGVIGLVGNNWVGTPIPEAEIEQIRRVLESRTAFSSYPFIRVGQRVRIRGGSLDGVEGILTDQKGNGSLVLSVSLIQRSIAVSIAGYDVEAA